MGKRAGTFHWKEFVAPTAMVRQVATVAAAEGAKLTLVRLLAGVRPHVGFQVALVGRSERAQVAAVRFLSCRRKRHLGNQPSHRYLPENKRSTLTCVNSDVFNESCCASGGIVAVAALELPVVGPLKTIHQYS